MFTNSGINKVFLIGKVSKDPQVYTFPDEPEVLCFQLVTKETIKKNGDDVEMMEYHNIKVPKEVAGLENELQDGQTLYLEGKIKTRSYVDEQQIKKYKLEVIATKYQILNEPVSVAV